MASSTGPEPDEEVHSFINDLERPVGTLLLGRRMYEVLAYWDDPSTNSRPSCRSSRRSGRPRTRSSTPGHSRRRGLAGRGSSTTSTWRPSGGWKSQSDRDLAIGPALAAQAIRAGLVDEYHMFVVPVVVGAGKQALPRDVRIDLELLDKRRSGNGTVFLRYRTRT